MTDTQPVEPPEDEELIQPSPVEQAQQFHDQIDRMKHWSRDTAQQIRQDKAILEATEEGTDDELAVLEQMIGLVSSVATRIEQGDNNRARQP